MVIRNWSKTPASNNSSPPDGAPEGWAPSAVNAVVRQQMADHKTQWSQSEWFDHGDTVTKKAAGKLNISGTHTATYMVGRRIRAIDGSGDWVYGVVTEGSLSSGDTILSVDIDGGGTFSGTITGIELGVLSEGIAGSALPGTWRLIQSQDASASSSLDFIIGINATYDHYMLVLTDVRLATDNTILYMRTSTDGGSTFRSTNEYDWTGLTTSTAPAVTAKGGTIDVGFPITSAQAAGNLADEVVSGIVRFSGHVNTNFGLRADWHTTVRDNANAMFSAVGGGEQLTAEDVDAVRIVAAAGNLTSGTVALYGLRK